MLVLSSLAGAVVLSLLINVTLSVYMIVSEIFLQVHIFNISTLPSQTFIYCKSTSSLHKSVILTENDGKWY